VLSDARCLDGHATAMARNVTSLAHWVTNPPLVDAVIALGVDMTADDPRLVVPVAVKSVTVAHDDDVSPWAASGEMVVNVVVVHDSGDRVELDLDVMTADGSQVALAVRGLAMRRVSAMGAERASAVSADVLAVGPGRGDLADVEQLGLSTADGVALLVHALDHLEGRVVVSRGVPGRRMDEVEAVPAPTVAAAPSADSGAINVEQVVREEWCRLLGVTDVSPSSDFFAQGGHSLIAVRMFSALRTRLGVQLGLSTLFEAPTFGGLAAAATAAVDLVRGPTTAVAERPAGLRRLIVRLSDHPSGDPLLCVHARGGSVVGLVELAREVGRHRPFYGIQAYGNDGAGVPDTSLKAMAERYANEVFELGLDRRIHLAGYSGGGLIATEMHRLLKARGVNVGELILFDTFHPKVASLDKKAKLYNLVANTVVHGVKETKAWWVRHRAQLAGWDEQMERWHQDMAMAGVIDLGEFFDLAASSYVPTRFEGPAHLITVTDFEALFPIRNGWTDKHFPNLSFNRVGGTHLDMLVGEHTADVATIVEQILSVRS
jgi:thioesterase domain-containing protein